MPFFGNLPFIREQRIDTDGEYEWKERNIALMDHSSLWVDQEWDLLGNLSVSMLHYMWFQLYKS